MAKVKITKNIIADTAFRVWGETGFHNMSLTLLSDELGITKAGLYRHFKNKDSLIDYMSQIIKDSIFNQLSEFISMANQLENPIDLYIDSMVNYFTDFPYRLFFYTIILTKGMIFNDEKMFELRFKQTQIFDHYLKKTGNKIDCISSERLLFYISSAVIYYLSFSFFLKFGLHKGKDITITETEKNIFKNDLKNIIFFGFANEKNIPSINYSDIETKSIILKKDIPERSKILNAIASLVAEDGMWNITIDKIAKKTKMAKSSLYLYFANKNEMIGNMIENEFKSLNDIFDSIINQYDNFYEKLYANICGTFSHFENDLEHLKILNWFHFQDMHIHKKNEVIIKRYNFILDMIHSKKIKNFSVIDVFPIIFLNVQISKDVMIYQELGNTINFENKRFLYTMFLNGLEGGNYEK